MPSAFWLGLSVGLLSFPLGLAIGFNYGKSEEIKDFLKKKKYLIRVGKYEEI